MSVEEGEDLSWCIEALAKHHDRVSFSCGNPVLDHYLKAHARQDARRFASAPFVLVPEPLGTSIFGYYTLSSLSVDLADLPKDAARKLPSYPDVPITLLGRLAVDHRHTGRGFGEILLMDALHRALNQSSQVAAVAVAVDAVDLSAARFYRHFHFIPFPDRPTRLFLPMRTIELLFGGKAPLGR